MISRVLYFSKWRVQLSSIVSSSISQVSNSQDEFLHSETKTNINNYVTIHVSSTLTLKLFK